MNIQVRDRKSLQASSRVTLAIADGDIHPRPREMTDLYPYMSKRWAGHFASYGILPRHGYQKGPAYPKGTPDASRRDAWPPAGGRPGSSLSFMQTQHLDANNIELGILNAITPAPGSAQNLDFGAAVASAMNDWQVAEWTSKDKRLKASIVVAYEDAQASAAEIDRLAGNPNFVQVLLMSRTAEPLGQRRYWPIYEAAVRANLPIGIHAFGYGGYPVTGGGWPSYYIEEMSGHAQCCQALLSSMIIEGVFERFPTLKVVLIESGFAWLPSLSWRLDKHWKTLKSETPHLKRLPSEYIRDHIWLTTQPMEEPERRRHLTDIIDWIGWDKLIFATDYPHWDFDDPVHALPIRPTDAQRQALFRGNARALYGI